MKTPSEIMILYVLILAFLRMRKTKDSDLAELYKVFLEFDVLLSILKLTSTV